MQDNLIFHSYKIQEPFKNKNKFKSFALWKYNNNKRHIVVTWHYHSRIQVSLHWYTHGYIR